MGRKITGAGWLAVVAAATLCGGCGDEAATGSGAVTSNIPFYVSEKPGSDARQSYGWTTDVEARCEFVRTSDGFAVTVDFESPEPGILRIDTGEYRVTVRSGRAGEHAEMPGVFVFRGRPSTYIDPLPDSADVPRMLFEGDTMRFVTEAVTRIRDSVAILLLYDAVVQSMTPAEEVAVIASLNAATGGHLGPGGATERYRSLSAGGTMIVEYDVPIGNSLFPYEVCSLCKAYAEAHREIFAGQVVVFLRRIQW